MAVPKRRELASRQNRKLKLCEAETSEYSLFLGLKYDFEHNSLPNWKKEKYFKLKEKFENEKTI